MLTCQIFFLTCVKKNSCGINSWILTGFTLLLLDSFYQDFFNGIDAAFMNNNKFKIHVCQSWYI